ncbi:MAG: zinc-ribbon domain-containing protein [archaeon]|nr:zinc-ribbon domain-containing protein [archaeon]
MNCGFDFYNERKCSNCGFLVDEDSIYCENCGNKLK